MDTEHLTKLPLVFQLIAGAGLFFGTFMLAVGGWFWNKIKPKIPDALKPPENQKDAVVLSAAIADSHSINKLATAIERLIERMEDHTEDEDRATHRLIARVTELNETGERIHDCTKRIEKSLIGRTLL